MQIGIRCSSLNELLISRNTPDLESSDQNTASLVPDIRCKKFRKILTIDIE